MASSIQMHRRRPEATPSRAQRGGGDSEHDARTDAVTLAVLATGEAIFSNTTWRGKRCMRVSVCNWQTGASDVARAVSAMRQVLLARMAGAAVRWLKR
ncbi:hypothetical protein [Massilia glaciei]|uniref:hypothetical protein n=1 Tax=Massilia glaciei TaxID=1524097 RepID=UPI0015E7F3C9|nr:hypothetical protein [Massilia glaciei]